MKTERKIVAGVLLGDDAEYMYKKSSEMPGLCPVCHNRLEDIPNMEYKIRKKKGDVFGTYDLFCVVTEKFKAFCKENKYPDLKFIPITASPGFYFFVPNGIYRLDYVRRKTKFMNKRDCCGTYDEIIGATPAYKAKGFIMPSDDFILRSEFRFGSFKHKDYMIIVGTKTMRKMKDYGIKGIYFEKVYE